jgi:hypothetical protein
MACEDVECVRLVYEVFPEAARSRDRYGKTCLHYAVLSVGKNHMTSVSNEEKELQETLLNQKESKDKDAETEEDDGYESEEIDIADKASNDLDERGISRDVIRFLISVCPQQLVMENNFMSTPVDTVLEKCKTMLTKKKRVSVFGLYDDPPTARLLLCAHKRYATLGILPAMRSKYFAAFRDLNWIARRDAMLMSFAGESRQKKGVAATVTNKKSRPKAPLDSEIKSESTRDGSALINILARLRTKGELDCLRLCISFI